MPTRERALWGVWSVMKSTSHNRASCKCGLWHHAQFPVRWPDGVCCGSYNDLQGAENRDYCAVATEGVSKRKPCWPGWRPAAGRGQCVYACRRALESSGDRRLRGTDRRF